MSQLTNQEKMVALLQQVPEMQELARALWGEGGGGLAQGGTGELSWWAHLQNMVVADDPIEYLGANI